MSTDAGGVVAPADPGFNCKCCGPRTSVYVTKSITVAASLAAGLFSTNQMIFDSDFRWHLIYFYQAALCILILSAEFNLLRHRIFKAFTGFLVSPTGRGITYIFIGGVILLKPLWGTVIGAFMIFAGLVNMFAWCFFPELKGDNDKYIQQEVQAQNAIIQQRARI